jgi:hypothetical protein
VRLAVDQKADRADIVEPLERLTQAIERIQSLETGTGGEHERD